MNKLYINGKDELKWSCHLLVKAVNPRQSNPDNEALNEAGSETKD